MSIDEMNGMIEGYKKIKDFCEGGDLAISKENSDIHEGARTALRPVSYTHLRAHET